ncbi:hypothetical protein K490DRAFT_62589 [Saccharata proteae CBS 121410]|uniref:Uncharacterized protein n=1 Tax=Saccharata proteae CBS 121410 TaxID=1314787 RepID=A0A9P4I1D6_9PEZI|nr:hypothetical protein K490DRAFT_62589 [Saccharata proteae CBS 121410]
MNTYIAQLAAMDHQFDGRLQRNDEKDSCQLPDSSTIDQDMDFEIARVAAINYHQLSHTIETDEAMLPVTSDYIAQLAAMDHQYDGRLQRNDEKDSDQLPDSSTTDQDMDFEIARVAAMVYHQPSHPIETDGAMLPVTSDYIAQLAALDHKYDRRLQRNDEKDSHQPPDSTTKDQDMDFEIARLAAMDYRS